ncbi:MAG TPA: cbb3-type cytochrome c oxidase subunit I [Noviherbaspirillum sp.]|uniref:cbb3-type cytochrome c oxidase subunit I n=1 Tax=Noviherbaspirillum sp. TaxID=1926288 RepID=UPI002B494045|nr:cbb3-type cytochrome c oxidase subunit I [Noviherbaspirillum sp.]HJV84274.1 cbb3-type cytochrome c oxidase subunit I [Noviherbaspirillum sp.]
MNVTTHSSHAAAGPALSAAPAATDFSIAVPRDARLSLARAWLSLSLASLIVAGILSVLLVLSRTPYLQKLLPVADFFHVALVVHVDLSVLVWFLSFAGLLWSINGGTRFMPLAWAGWTGAAAGAAIMSLAPFFGRGGAIMSNYVPVLDDPLFLGGLVVFGIGIALLALRAMLTAPKVGTRPDGQSALSFGLNTAAVATAVALFALVWSLLRVPATVEAKGYYELLFWGSGHVIQFTYTLMMLVAWLWLANACGARVPLTPRVALLLFAIGLASVFAVPPIYLAYDPTSVEHRNLLTWLMRFGGGLPILPVALAVVIGMAGRRGAVLTAQQKPLHAALVSSLALFAIGGLIGFLIHGSNVKIPAHYHGCIVGVTLALMGLAYHLLPHFGYVAPSSRMAAWQPYIYGFGQLLHIVGLVWSGGYGVQRKVAGSEQVLRSTQEIAGMGLMGLGGLIAIIGGIIFLVVVLKAMRAGVEGTRA